MARWARTPSSRPASSTRASVSTGLIVTKLDGTSRGGALVGIYRELKLPIYFLGLGEQPEDLQPFSVENYAKAVFGLE
jgi:fused signal recognition particle receptor